MWSTEQLEQLGVTKNVSCMPDLVYAPMEKRELTLPFKDYVVISPSLLIDKYAKNRQEYIDLCNNIIKFLNDYTKLPVVIMPHSTDLFARYLAMKLEGGTCVFPYDATDARQILTNSKFNVCFRMHSALQGLQGGVPCAAIAYSQKYFSQIPHSMIAKPTLDSIAYVVKKYYNCSLPNIYKYSTQLCQQQITKEIKKLIKMIP